MLDYLLETYPDYLVVNVDSLSYAADPENTKEAERFDRYVFVHGDITQSDLLRETFEKYAINAVMHFAAESHVDNSLKDPGAFVHSNILGSYTLLEVARRYWEKQNWLKEARFHHVSTDEVYGSLGPYGLFTEESPYQPNSPYSASKASSDFLARAYHHSFGMNLTISNCSNNYGPRQHDEKLIPTVIRSCFEEKEIPIYGDGKNIRDWLYVKDHVRAVDLIFHRGTSGQTYNVGCQNEKTNLELLNLLCSCMDRLFPRRGGTSYEALQTFVKDRAGHDRRYAIDNHKIQTQLGFSITSSFEEKLQETVSWYWSRYSSRSAKKSS
ncbi:unnamed protein product [Darwinula stevensoni]|uniref:NAD(P)-binding domain-containing protein n=1 Tax=Darwinula stevensoni TaxID=69355 RepID=A0A7R8XFL6_9CRUS|nr:unnamed protein product [Darwinula stevensoni]CAG0888944.1 unnamed protein product [Darwinula stevensoni]